MSIELKNVSFQYAPQSTGNHFNLKNINLTIGKGEFVAVVGHTGCGKSTLIQHLNGLLQATEGSYHFHGEDVYGDQYNKKLLRSKVGMTFQYPEHQLFEATVMKDVCFGPMNMGLTREEAEIEARKALEAVGIDEKHFEKSPFELSGGQKRRVAIAGVLAMNPEYFVLDEPTAGLDPRGRKKILDLIKKLHVERNMTIILVSHSMEDVAEYANRILVMNGGRLVCDGTPREVFYNEEIISQMGMIPPEAVSFTEELTERGFFANSMEKMDAASPITVDEVKRAVLAVLQEGSK